MSLRQAALGSWTLASVTVDGPSKAEPYGRAPKGIMMLGADGHFSVIIAREGVPKFAANNRMSGTDAENKAAVQGSLAYFGSYTIDEDAGTISVTIAGSTFPNFEGQTQLRELSFADDALIVTNPTPSGGGGVARQVWKRAGG